MLVSVEIEVLFEVITCLGHNVGWGWKGGRDVSVLSPIVKYSKSPASAKCPTKRIYFQKLLHFIPSYLRLLKILVRIRISYVTKVCADKFRWKDICEWVPISSTHPSTYEKRTKIGIVPLSSTLPQVNQSVPHKRTTLF